MYLFLELFAWNAESQREENKRKRYYFCRFTLKQPSRIVLVQNFYFTQFQLSKNASIIQVHWNWKKNRDSIMLWNITKSTINTIYNSDYWHYLEFNYLLPSEFGDGLGSLYGFLFTHRLTKQSLYLICPNILVRSLLKYLCI